MVLSAIEQYCIQENAFPYERNTVIDDLIKKQTGRRMNFLSLPAIQQKPVGITTLYQAFFWTKRDLSMNSLA